MSEQGGRVGKEGRVGREERVGRPKGTNDLLPPESWRYYRLVQLGLGEIFAAAGYAPIETPAFEHTDVFVRGVGEASEVVTKQMYTFTDLGGRSLTLRPEGTAPVMRAVLENGLDRGALPVKLSYAGPMFRQERPQKGRYRQFFQFGIEAIGTDDPAVDAEVIEIGMRFLSAAGTRPTLLLNSIGHPDGSCRAGYLETLKTFLRDNGERLASADRQRVDTNPLRTFDSKEPETIATMRDAPTIADHLCDACAKHFAEVQSLLGSLGVVFEIEPRLVRGLDYYTRTAFEFTTTGLGAQDALGGGGRYDGLSESLGGPPLPGIGFALGADRILLAAEDQLMGSRIVVYVVAVGDELSTDSLELATELRRAGIGADLDLMGRAMKGQMKAAGRSGARWVAILGREEMDAGEVTLKDLESGDQKRVSRGGLIDTIRKGLPK